MPDSISLNYTATAARFQSRMNRFIQRLDQDGGKATEDQMRSVHSIIVSTSPVDKGPLRAHWGPVTQRGPLTYGAGNDRSYAATLEYGGYVRVGPKTVGLGGGDLGAGFVAGAGIYSRQAPLGFVRRALADAAPQYGDRLRNVLRQLWGT
jgi:hypothetical protein